MSSEHQFWQGPLPACFASEKIDQIQIANPHINALRAHHNAHEVQRELRQTPQRAWNQAKKENRSVPLCPCWPYIWSLRTPIKIGPDGRVPIGTQRLRLEKPPGTKVVLCLHPTGHHSVLAAQPSATEKPVLLFTNRPR